MHIELNLEAQVCYLEFFMRKSHAKNAKTVKRDGVCWTISSRGEARQPLWQLIQWLCR